MKYAIFDLDGTIVDSMYYWRNFFKDFLKEKGLEPLEELEQISKVKWVQGICDFMQEKYNISISPQQLHDWAMDYIMEKYKNVVPFKPGAKEFLDALHSQGVKMCICSSTDRYLMEPVLQRLDLLKYFQFTTHCRQYGKEKNEPDIFLYCMKELGAKSPEEVAVFEDAVYSAQTAKNEGFYVVGIYDETEPKQEQLKNLSDQYIIDYKEIDFSKLPK